MEEYILKKEYFGRSYTFMQVRIEQIPDATYIKKNGIDGVIVITDTPNEVVSNIKNISTLQELRGLDLNSYTYKDLNDLLCLRKLEYLRMEGKCESNIPFSSLSMLQCVYLNYNKKNCASIFECKQLENIFIDNYSETSSTAFSTFKNAKRIGLIKSKITEFEAIHNLHQLEHIGIGYNSKMESISWLRNNNSLTSLGFQNCKKIKDWEEIGSLGKIEKIILENCGEIPSLSFLQNISSLKELRIIGSTSIGDGKIKELMHLPNLKHIFVPIKKEYDITLDELTAYNNN
ncbi:hypothetical protein [Prevotella pallens]|uniref:hypothetical protein n=1 Tax=Prevotella pallens TaxID=60133 RepID=UPI001CB1FD3B|nr:hypothetical protein [Prevotella pallens]MBF1462176.1 hypothetical protein [Prevotella pallens]